MMKNYIILPLAVIFFASILIISPPSLSTAASAETTASEVSPEESAGEFSIGEAFVGEEFTYSIGFWILSNVAEGTIRLTRDEEGQYVAILSAHTTGAIGRFFRSRKDTYTTHLKIVESGDRFVTGRLEKDVRIGKKIRKSVQKLDYDKGTLSWTTYKKGKIRRTGEMPIPPGEKYDGPLTAFYNLRHGVYGPIEEGREYFIKTIPKKDKPMDDIELRIATSEEFKKHVGTRDNGAKYFARAIIDKDFFDSKTGVVEILFNEDMVPVEAVAKDVLLFGDIRGRLVKAKEGDNAAARKAGR